MRILQKYGVNGESGTDAKNYVEIALNSNETKPTDMIAAGSVALETDTGKVYLFDETSGWVLMKTIKEG